MERNYQIKDTIISIETEYGQKVVHYFGYGYESDDDEGNGKNFRFLEYCGFYVPMDEVLYYGLLKTEQYHLDRAKEYITDCTEEECYAIYEHYDNGKMPTIIDENKIRYDTPDGVYIVHSQKSY